MKIADSIFGWLLILASLMHSYGSLHSYSNAPVTLVWAQAGALAGIMLAAVNLLRIGRPKDRALAWVSLGGCLAWVAVAVAFGAASGNVFDPRPITHMVIGAVLAMMSVRAL